MGRVCSGVHVQYGTKAAARDAAKGIDKASVEKCDGDHWHIYLVAHTDAEIEAAMQEGQK